MRLKDVPKEMRERIKEAMDRTWGAIASDVMDIEEGNSICRAAVIEWVLDADRIKMYGEDEEAVEILYSLPHTAKRALAREAFPSRYYGR